MWCFLFFSDKRNEAPLWQAGDSHDEKKPTVALLELDNMAHGLSARKEDFMNLGASPGYYLTC